MPRSDTAVSEAVTIIRILRLIPRHRRITAREIAAGLTDSGITLPYRRLQRILQNICDCTELNIECDRRSKPFGYVQRMPESALPVSTLRKVCFLAFARIGSSHSSRLPSLLHLSLCLPLRGEVFRMRTEKGPLTDDLHVGCAKQFRSPPLFLLFRHASSQAYTML